MVRWQRQRQMVVNIIHVPVPGSGIGVRGVRGEVIPTKFITMGMAGRLIMSVGVPDCTRRGGWKNGDRGGTSSSSKQSACGRLWLGVGCLCVHRLTKFITNGVAGRL
jgi:hypothetical protein